MSRRLKKAAVVSVAVFAAAQLIRPARTNPVTELNRTIEAQMGAASAVPAILDRSCGDCHSNKTVWPWYTGIAPVSWLMAQGVSEGRRVVNFSEWGAYSPEQQRALLAMSCDAASAGRMPGIWTRLHPETRLSARDIETICAVARQTDSAATLAGGSK